MHLIRNRIIVSLIFIALATFAWEFYIKPVSGPLYTAAVAEYKNQNYNRSLDLLWKAWNVDPNDTAILTLMGWNYLKLGEPKSAETHFARAYGFAPHIVDLTLGYAYTQIELEKFDEASKLLKQLSQTGERNADIHLAWAALYRKLGRNREAAEEFQNALAVDPENSMAVKNLQEMYNVTGDVSEILEKPEPFVRPAELTFPFRARGDFFARHADGRWRSVYLAGVNLLPTLPGRFPAESITDPTLYADWLKSISGLGANTIRVYTLLPPAFYRALHQFNSSASRPLWLLQGVSFGDPPQDNLFDPTYIRACQERIRNAIDVIHGQGDVASRPGRVGGIYNFSISEWVSGLVVGESWLSHVVTRNNQINPEVRTFQGTYIEAPNGNPTEIFLAQMIDYAVDYEVKKYNWQRPVAFLNWPTLDPLRHPTESTLLEEISIRRAVGERVGAPPGPYDDDDAVSLDPMRLKPRETLVAGYFAAYSVQPFYPDFLNYDPRYQNVQDSEGPNPLLGYLQDLKSYHQGVPLLIIDYGIPSSLGVGHFSPAGFDEGGKTEAEQGRLLARFTQNVHSAGAAGGTVLEWLDQWFRQSWIERRFEMPPERRILWTNFMNPPGHFGLLAADPRGRGIHLLQGDPAEWANKPPVYAEVDPPMAEPAGDRYDPARDLKALYADADEGFLYLRLVAGKLDNDHNGRPDWGNVNYVIGVGTVPDQAGLTYLPFIAPVRFPMGMTYAIQLGGPDSTRVLIASTYYPYEVRPVEGIPAQNILGLKLGRKPAVTDSGRFESQIAEPNRRRFSRDGKYFPPRRYERGVLREGNLNPRSPNYDSLAGWNASVQTNSIDLRIPWSLLGVTDPSSFKVFMGLERDGTVTTADTPGFILAAFSYKPRGPAQARPIMEQRHPIADALPGMAGPAQILAGALKPYRWAGWSAPQYSLRLKGSYAILQRTFQALPESPAVEDRPADRAATGSAGRQRGTQRRGDEPPGR
ncbi:MAG: tetratricopeptide repeat protein [Acidobacteria bacterium]|nr:tetratricopeptide repeat protein [Acidobacteriota bacterium]